ncbi:unnamed protein product [Euphydryas editha]|uniref:Uncharacterized protein n=1 Tax=Euphydryas editha TaxID=104508 RepID=A0AAU9TRE6_EUPED|nr:unnamed protein product [Euphydryas editha]
MILTRRSNALRQGRQSANAPEKVRDRETNERALIYALPRTVIYETATYSTHARRIPVPQSKKTNLLVKQT